MNTTTFGLDLAQHVFQLHWVDMETGELYGRRLKREQVAAFFAQRPPSLVAMEACGTAHHWARRLSALGHEVRLIAPKFVRPFVKTNKTDAADAQAIWEAAQRPGMKFVAVKNEAQQAVLALHRLRTQLVKMRTMQTNQLRGLLYEFGVNLPRGRQRGLARVADELARVDTAVPPVLVEVAHEQLERIAALDHDIASLERRLARYANEDEAVKRVMAIPGVGPLTATAVVATIGNAKAFNSGREFAAFVGLVPRQCGTGGRVRLLGISKRGDVYLRTLLIHGARALITHQKEPGPWLEKLLARRPFNVAVVGVANRIARKIWALLAHDRTFDPQHAARAA